MLSHLTPRELSPAALVGLLLVLQMAAWTLAPGLTHSSPPLDVVESYMWGREWVIATFKHPSMPGWALETSHLLTGTYGWPAYVVSQIFICTTFVFVFLLGRDLMGPERAAAGTLLLTGIAYFAWWTPELKHNIAETPFWAAIPFLVWRAIERKSVGYWLLAGVVAGIGMYARITVGLIMAATAIWVLYDPRARKSLATPGPWLGVAVYLCLSIPLIRWMIASDFLPLTYAAERATRGTSAAVPLFFVDTLINMAGVFVMLAIAGLLPPLRRGAAPAAAPEPPVEPVDGRVLPFLLIITLVPFAIAILGAVISGGGLKTGWGNSMLNFVGLIAVALTSRRFSRDSLDRIAVSAAVLLVTVSLGYALMVSVFHPRSSTKPLRASWPQKEMTARMNAIWTRETSQPLRVVGGDAWIAGLVGLSAPAHPSIFINGEYKISPWITPDRLAREGALYVWDARSPDLPDTLEALVGGRPVREEQFDWPRYKRAAPLVVRYVIVPPTPGTSQPAR